MKKTPSKQSASKKTDSKKAPSKKQPAKKMSAKKAPSKKPLAKKVSAKKAAGKKLAAQKPPANKPPAQKTTQKAAKTVAPKPSAGPKLAAQVKDFVLQGTNGPFKLSDLHGRHVVLYFYPKDNTPGCTIEGHEFSNLLSEFKNSNAVVYGISRDTLKSHQGFRLKQNYKVDLLSDEKEFACSLFDVVKDKNMYGKKVRGIERSTFVIGADGALKKEWRKVKVEGHAQEVLEYVKHLNSTTG